jgi:hypothetical protein
MTDAMNIQAGDVVICIDDRRPRPMNIRHIKVRDRIKKGNLYRVTAVVWLFGEKGLHLLGVDHRPTDGWRAARFRKVLPCDDEFACALRSDQPTVRILEDA